ncbi:MAG TPA: phosphate ABC transporter permease subunit PstC [Acidimicrobiales bacterium]|nr:phosphate ABC transporter permease subunit PstC [Acidimicrobiales bacterium]
MSTTTPFPAAAPGQLPGDIGSGSDARGSALLQQTVPRVITAIAAILPMVALFAIVIVLAVKAFPAIKYNGLHFLWSSDWRPGNSYAGAVKTNGVLHPVAVSYGAWPLIAGTLATSVIAVLFAVPVSVGAALLIVEKLPASLSKSFGIFLEVLAGIPSVVFGLWGYLTFGPFLAHDLAPLIADHLPNVPVLSFFRGPTGNGEGLLASGLVLGVMIIPIVAATSRDLLRQVPRLPKEGAMALGMSDWEVVRKVSLPWARAGILGASVLGLARALGETMAVAMISGSLLGTLPTNLYQGVGTIAATIVNQLDGAQTDGTGFAVETLAEFALLLAVITLVTNVGARALVRKMGGTALPVGRGV